MNRIVFVDGLASDVSNAIASPLGLRSGVGAFEVFRTHERRLPTVHLHLERLSRSLLAMNIACDLARIRRDVEGAVARIAGDARVDVRVERTESGVHDTVIATAYSATECVPTASAASVRGRRVTTPGHKVLAYGAHGDALAEARARGCDDALLIDEDGLVREAATANVFAVSGRTLLTAPDGVLAGITRRLVLELASSVNLTVAYKALALSDLFASDAVFLTSSVRGIALVNSIDGTATGAPDATRVAHRIARALNAHLRQR